ncbi:MAG: CDP-alcohol phosphatidyltransferase family protein [Limnochordaceae bacterium]|nr:CDP-alcohol phosphatidyltransferase family protein [Limnochordaceae bacterium]
MLRATHHEERLRDAMLSVLLHAFPSWVTPDHLTVLRALLAAGAVALWASGAPLRPVLGILAGAALTDFVDGPLARCRGRTGGNGGRLDQLADVVLGISLGVLALGEGLVGRALVGAMVLPEALSAAGSACRRAPLAARPTSLARLQFVLVIVGFWVTLLGSSMRSGSVAGAGRGLLWAEAGIACVLAVLRLGGWYPQRPLG